MTQEERKNVIQVFFLNKQIYIYRFFYIYKKGHASKSLTSKQLHTVYNQYTIDVVLRPDCVSFDRRSQTPERKQTHNVFLKYLWGTVCKCDVCFSHTAGCTPIEVCLTARDWFNSPTLIQHTHVHANFRSRRTQGSELSMPHLSCLIFSSISCPATLSHWVINTQTKLTPLVKWLSYKSAGY